MIRDQEVWARWKPELRVGNRSLLIGVREDDGELLILSPGKQHAPHTLIAGSTGSGKSVLMQNIILGIAATNTPAQAASSSSIRSRASTTSRLRVCRTSGAADRRSGRAILRRTRAARRRDGRAVREVPGGPVSEPETIQREGRREPDRLAVIWVIHDEFAEWMMVDEYKDAVTSIVGGSG